MSEYVIPSEEITLPSGRKAVVREITGKAENVIADENLIKQGKMVTRLIHRLLESLDGDKMTERDVENLYTADRRAILLKARELTHGPELSINHVCNNTRCGQEYEIRLNINEDIEWTPMPEEPVQEVLLPASKLIAKIAPITGVAEARLARTKPEERLTEAVFVYVKEIESLSGPNAWLRFLENASARDTAAIRNAAQNVEFGPETTQETECPICGAKQNVEITNEVEFFFPTTT